MTAHSLLGASSMHRWSVCPGSVRLSADAPPVTNAAAEEGTEAHAYAAWCIDPEAGGRRPYKTHFLEYGASNEMIDCVAHYYDYVYDNFDGAPDLLMVEQRFDLSGVHPGCFGTADAVIWKPAAETLVVVDYKHGKKRVHAQDNPQLMYYALGALLNVRLPAKRVRMVIAQPRCGGEPIAEWEIDAADLLDFRMDLVRYARATAAPDAPLVPGDHCFFCPAGQTCPAQREKRARNAFDPVDDDLVASLPPFLRRSGDTTEKTKEPT